MDTPAAQAFPPIEIFRAGRQTDMAARVREFTVPQLQAIAASYDPAKGEAPIVIGHPKDTTPAHGWIKSLQVVGNSLYATPHQVNPAFAQLHRSGAYKKHSAEFYAEANPYNPTPGQLYLKSVGFLGAQPPAVMGLRDAQFAQGDGEVIAFEQAAPGQPGALAQLLRGVREFVLGKHGADEADRLIPNTVIDQAAAPDPAFAQPATPGPTTHEDDMDAAQAKKLADLEADNARLKAEADAAKAQVLSFAQAQLAATQSANVAFVDDQVKAGRVLPAARAQMVTVLNALSSAGESGVISFAQADGTAAKLNAADWLKAQVSAAQPLISFGQHAAGDVVTTSTVGANADDLALDKAARAHMAAHPTVSYAQALSAVVVLNGPEAA